MSAWFRSRSGREQLLLVAMAAIAAGLCLYQFALKPVFAGHQQAQIRSETAQRSLNTVARVAPQLTGASINTAAKDFDRSQLIQMSSQYGLSISRTQPQNNGELQIWFDNTGSANVFSFVAAVEREFAAKVTRLNVNRLDAGRVKAQLTITPLGTPQ